MVRLKENQRQKVLQSQRTLNQYNRNDTRILVLGRGGGLEALWNLKFFLFHKREKHLLIFKCWILDLNFISFKFIQKCKHVTCFEHQKLSVYGPCFIQDLIKIKDVHTWVIKNSFQNMSHIYTLLHINYWGSSGSSEV